MQSWKVQEILHTYKYRWLDCRVSGRRWQEMRLVRLDLENIVGKFLRVCVT